jgi:hypothetical protein
VAKEVAGIFKGKSAEQLAGIQKQIESTISQRAEGVDIGYWESLLSQLKGKQVIQKNGCFGAASLRKIISAHMARARLRDKHQNNLMKKLLLLKNQQGVKEELGDEQRPSTSTVKDEATQIISEDSRNTKGTSEDENDDEEDK